MIRLSLSEIAAAVGGVLGEGTDGSAVVSGGVTIDSRSVAGGDLFVALRGERVDGHDFAAAALAGGAAGVLATRPVPGPSVLVDDPVGALGRLARAVRDRLPQLRVIGVTGSSGKTGTKDLLAAVLAGAGPTVSAPGSLNNELGVPLTLLRAEPSTRFLVCEMGARGVGHIGYLCGIARPDSGVVLNVGAAHAGEFGSREATARAKGELVEALPASGLAVLNADDPLVAAMAARTRARVVRTGVHAPGADVRAERIRLDEQARASFELATTGGTAAVRLRLHGVHHVGNALAAAAVGLDAGLGPDQVASALSAAEGAGRWRMEVSRRDDGLVVVNDAYNANPDSVAAALRALAAMPGSGWAVLGEMLELGPASGQEHRAAGRLAARLGLRGVIAVGPGAAGVAEGAVAGGIEATVADGPDEALALVRDLRRAGRVDTVLVKASRSIGLERLAAELLAMAPAAGEPAPTAVHPGTGRVSTVSTLESDGAPPG